MKTKIYSKGGVFQAENNPRDINNKNSINIELSPVLQGQPDYQLKHQFQLSDKEIILLAALLIGLLPVLEIPRPEKFIKFERQSNKIYVKAGSKTRNTLYTMPFDIADTAILSIHILDRIKCEYPSVDSDLILMAIRGAASLYKRD